MIKKITHLVSDVKFYESRLKIANLIYIYKCIIISSKNKSYIHKCHLRCICRNNNKGFKEYKSKLNKLKLGKKSR